MYVAMRLFVLSDIHTDFEENESWLGQLSKTDYLNDALILAGDISDSISRIERCFEQVCKRFEVVFFVPGNHDLWVNRCGSETSLKKFGLLKSMCRQYGIQISRSHIGNTEIIPLLGWYDYSFGSLSPELERAWMDFRNCRWPSELRTTSDVCEYFLSQNSLEKSSAGNVVTFSHFVPRIDLMPHYIPSRHRVVYPVLGSLRIDEQLRELGSSLHVYGHSHVNRDLRLNGVRYVNNAQGYPSETWIDKRLQCVVENL
ncbi:metallophosphoesterase [Teredinibacter turnerae]|uniref:metallophosphoesterase n=1 Tax=Teredinibacter turnerae TaxID=2426 RepID=UPI0003603F38|nr:metallophosphoesterase [Teredinibacter turnerae]